MLSKISRKKKPFLSYGYLSVFGRPIDSLALHSMFEFNIEILRYASVEYALAPIPSVLLGSMMLRLLMEGVGLFTKDLKFENYGNRSSHTVINNVFKVDLERDIKFYVSMSLTEKIPDVQANTKRKYYTPNERFKYLVNGYLMLNIGRSLNLLLNDERYNSFLLMNPNLSLMNIDPTFLTPIAIMAINYFVISGSTHPFIVNIKQRKLQMWNLAFMSGLLFVPMPILHQSTYIGFMVMHTIIRSAKRIATKYKEKRIQNMFSYIK